MQNWFDIDYLRRGSARQRAAYDVLLRLQVFEVLAAFSPVLTGTIPLGIDVSGSDLDVICEVYDLKVFTAQVKTHFSGYVGFSASQQQVNGLPVVVATFTVAGFSIEIFGQPCPVRQQNAYQHLVAEARLLELGGKTAQEEIRRLKTMGLKTELAFAEYFALPGNPYATLFHLADVPAAELRWLVERGQLARQECTFC